MIRASDTEMLKCKTEKDRVKLNFSTAGIYNVMYVHMYMYDVYGIIFPDKPVVVQLENISSRKTDFSYIYSSVYSYSE